MKSSNSFARDTEVIEVLPIKKTGTGPMVFCIHDVTGKAVSFHHLAPFLQNELYAIQDHHIGSIAGSLYWRHGWSLRGARRSIQLSGPYILCGHSFGGLVALCMATQLLRAGEHVQHLIPLDSIYIPCQVWHLLQSSDWTRIFINRRLINVEGITNEWMHKLEVEISQNMDLMLEYDPAYYRGFHTLAVPPPPNSRKTVAGRGGLREL
ncbi:alpha/beta-hydrolase [Paxillus ammoniavirescens]|nr:alpha/beta-hydrolase [Paxillus ammoniavirescens]